MQSKIMPLYAPAWKMENGAAVYDCKQLSEEWKELHLGRVTASPMDGILPGSKGAYLASRKNYMAEKIVEMITGERDEGYESPEMRWGTETELLARAAYEVTTGRDVVEVGFVVHPDVDRLGASPDGLVGDDGGIEIKCPKTATHINTLLTGRIEPKYITQIQTCLFVTGRAWWDFISYDPRMGEPNLQIFIKRILPDPALHLRIHSETLKFLDDLDAQFAGLAAYGSK